MKSFLRLQSGLPLYRKLSLISSIEMIAVFEPRGGDLLASE